jgi:peptide/nickel transport system substrate-binding protein
MYAKLRYLVRLTIAYIVRFRGIIIISAVLGVFVFVTILFLTRYLYTPTVERIGMSGRYYSDNLPESVLSLLSDGVTHVDDAGYIEPGLAESWETPDKGKTWIFKLKENIFWQDGTEVTSDSIHYDFTDVTVERPDSLTIVFKLDQPYSPFPSVVSTPVFKKGLLGMGKWKVKNISVVGNYIEELTIEDAQKNVKIYRFYPTVERTKLAFKLGEVDSLIDLSDASSFSNWQTAKITNETKTDEIVTLFFNTQEKGVSEKSLRQALSYAINKDELGERATSSIPQYSWGFNPQVKRYDFDQKRAKELVEDLPNESKENLEIKLLTTPNLVSVADKIASDWKNIGIPTTVQVSTVTPTDYQVFLTVYNVPKDPDQYSIWHSTQTNTNISHYSSPRIDKLLEDGRIIIDTQERRKVYLDFQRFLLEDAPAVFLYYPQRYEVKRK